jgi:uncharacterized membrane protein YbaN (DUF454 family)
MGALGFLSVGFGIAGIFIPIWPSTVFFIIACALFARSHPKAEQWLMEHPKIGKGLRNWREHRSISRSAKVSATLAIAVSFGLSIFLVELFWLRLGLVALGLLLVGYICSRPEAENIDPRSRQDDVA